MESVKSAFHKFAAQGKQFFPDMYRGYSSFAKFKEQESNIPEGTFCMITDVPGKELHIPGYFLGEVLLFPEDNQYSVSAIKRSGRSIDIILPSEVYSPHISGISLNFLCTETGPYVEIMKRSIPHYVNILSKICPFEISVVYFGKNPPNIANNHNIVVYPENEFSIAYAMNRGIDNCSLSHTLMVDVDCFLSQKDVEYLCNKITTEPSHGVYNIKVDHRTGNGLFFACTDLLRKNRYDERFRAFWFEDTEFLMNFCRMGIVPCVEFFPNLHIENHCRGKKHLAENKNNKNLFYKILMNGR
jgi:hypothetical protein